MKRRILVIIFNWILFSNTYLRTIRVQYLKILLSSFAGEDFQRSTLNLLRSNFACYFADNASVQHLRILFSSFGEEDFQRFCIKLSLFKLFLAIISPIMRWRHHLNKL